MVLSMRKMLENQGHDKGTMPWPISIDGNSELKYEFIHTQIELICPKHSRNQISHQDAQVLKNDQYQLQSTTTSPFELSSNRWNTWLSTVEAIHSLASIAQNDANLK